METQPVMDVEDNLARDAVAATKAGMSYGQWKASHPRTKKEKENGFAIENPEKVKIFRTCLVCGKRFEATPTYRKMCSEKCRAAREKEHQYAYQEKWRRQQREMREGENT